MPSSVKTQREPPWLKFRIGHYISEFPCASVSKRVFLKNRSCENEFDLHENESVGRTQFHVNGFARRFVLTPRRKQAWKWPVATDMEFSVALNIQMGLVLNQEIEGKKPS